MVLWGRVIPLSVVTMREQDPIVISRTIGLIS